MKTPELEQMLKTMESDGGIDRSQYIFILGFQAFEKYKPAIVNGKLNGLPVGVYGDGPELTCIPALHGHLTKGQYEHRRNIKTSVEGITGFN